MIDGLRDVQDKLRDMRESLDLYKITKADQGELLTQIFRTPRRQPGGPAWASVLALQKQMQDQREIPNKEFDSVLTHQHEAQMAMNRELRRYQKSRMNSVDMAKLSMKEAAEAAGDASKLLAGAGTKVSMMPLVLPPGPAASLAPCHSPDAAPVARLWRCQVARQARHRAAQWDFLLPTSAAR